MDASQKGVCSFCWQHVPWKQYARHLDKYHRHGAVKPIQHRFTNVFELIEAANGELVELPMLESTEA